MKPAKRKKNLEARIAHWNTIKDKNGFKKPGSLKK
jgi:hypothetical protein